MELQELIDGFASAEPMADVWRRYPDVSADEDDATDTWACDQAGARFAAYVGERGGAACVVRATEAEHPWADYHVWTRVVVDGEPVNVDFTARQYHTLDGVGEAALSATWPLMWPGTEPVHPLVGRFGAVLVVRPRG